MKKFISSFILLLFIFSNLYGQISITEATQIVNDYIEELRIKEHRLYRNPKVFPSEIEIQTFNKSITSVWFDAWVFFLDKVPLAGWSHPCSYLFVDVNSGKVIEKKWKLPPNGIEKWQILTEIKEQAEVKLFDFKKRDVPILKSGLTPSHCYAVIISGGKAMGFNPKRYWNDCAAVYSALVNVYNYTDSHIYTLISDGTNPANDRKIGTDQYDSSPLDLDGDGDNDIQYSATRTNISSVFNTLSGILDNDDYLFIFVTDHGDQESSQDVFIYLWGENEIIRDDQLATEINKVDAGEICILMQQCFSGGFIDDLDEENRVIATACNYDEVSYAMGEYTYDEFVYFWIGAVAGEDPDGYSVDADENDDGYVSMQEAFNYAMEHDTQLYETPQYNSNKYTLGVNLTLLGKEICISNDWIYNVTITSDQTIEDCEIYIDHVTINNNADVVLDAEKEVVIFNDFEVKSGSTLEIK